MNRCSLAAIAIAVVNTSAYAAPRLGSVAFPAAPITAKDDAALAKQVARRSGGRSVVTERDGQWRIFYAVAFAAPIETPELTIRITDPVRNKVIVSRDKYAFGTRSAVQGSLVIGRDDLVSNSSRLILELDHAGTLVARGTFFIQGKPAAEHDTAGRTKSVDFAVGDTKATEPVIDVETVRNKKRVR